MRQLGRPLRENGMSKGPADTADRKLTERELRRAERFKQTTNKLQDRGYKPIDLVVSIARANVRGLLLALPCVIVLVSLFVHFAPFSAEDSAFTVSMGLAVVLSIVIFLALVVVHELIHGLIWGIFAKDHFRAIEFGVVWSMLTPYCTCSEPLTKGQYVLGAIMPMLVLGVGLGVVSVFTGSVGLLVLAVLMILAGGGDLLIVLLVLMYKTPTKDALYCDHPYQPGVVVFQK